MPPKRGAKRTRTVRARVDAREVVDDQGTAAGVQAEGVPPVAPPIDQAALMQMVQAAATQAAQAAIQQVTQEAARVAAQEAARVAAQEVARQLAAAQVPPQQIPAVQIPQVPPQQIPAVQIPQDPAQQIPAAQIPQVPLQQVPGQQILPPPSPLPQVYPAHDERYYRLTSMMKNMGMEHFVGTVDPTAAYDWKLSLKRKLENIDCPQSLSLD
ncbi:gamma-gliadin-like [Raphanus sativus]|uniref:Gamma-gliadin-like n=1 Tax=Raphanus sativus TaxID=3726 RepID=A0A9W3BRA5_RAPSA|nr:gamma-gliadin-like [Raphanus sativus]